MFTAMVAWIVRLSCNFSGTNSSVWQLKGYLKRIENMFQNVVEDFYVLLSPIIQMYPDVSRYIQMLNGSVCLGLPRWLSKKQTWRLQVTSHTGHNNAAGWLSCAWPCFAREASRPNRQPSTLDGNSSHWENPTRWQVVPQPLYHHPFPKKNINTPQHQKLLGISITSTIVVHYSNIQ